MVALEIHLGLRDLSLFEVSLKGRCSVLSILSELLQFRNVEEKFSINNLCNKQGKECMG
jgi:hypothetical protein